MGHTGVGSRRKRPKLGQVTGPGRDPSSTLDESQTTRGDVLTKGLDPGVKARLLPRTRLTPPSLPGVVLRPPPPLT